MRNEMEKILKETLRNMLLIERAKRNLTQKKMSEILFMSRRSYADLEDGVNMCGTLTAFLILMAQPDPHECLQNQFSELYETESRLA